MSEEKKPEDAKQTVKKQVKRRKKDIKRDRKKAIKAKKQNEREKKRIAREQKIREIKTLLDNPSNRGWAFMQVGSKLIAALGFATLIDQAIQMIPFMKDKDVVAYLLYIILIGSVIWALAAVIISLIDVGHLKIETERSGCFIEVRVADSYITNAFVNYPKSAMLIGINKCFWFREAEPNSLVADLWKELEKRGIDRIKVQEQIDETLHSLHEKGMIHIDETRPKVRVRKSAPYKESDDKTYGSELRDNYEVGTVIGIDLRGRDESGKDFFKKLYFIANAEIVQGKNLSEQIKVAPDKHKSVVETFENIWTYFEQDEIYTENPPYSRLYSPLLVPLIGAGVANEGYTDLEIFSRFVDLYYKHLRGSVRKGAPPAVPHLIINIRNTTAIAQKDALKERKIDLKTAEWYIKYRNTVNPPRTNMSKGE